jgi:apolipoprotein N-acyltransferase
VAYFGANLWWLWTATVPGTIAIVLYYALFWALAASFLRWLGLLGPLEPRAVTGALRVMGVAAVWVACEWLRCYCPSGFPWIPVGTTQWRLVPLCQVADLGGPWIVSFWVSLPNALVAIWWLHRPTRAPMLGAGLVTAAVILFVATYGFWRLATTHTKPGPVVMVLQSNFRHLPGGAATIEPPQLVEHFLVELRKRLADHPADLVVLPESVLPPVNDEARAELARSPVGPFLEHARTSLLEISAMHRTAILVGGTAVTGWSVQGTEHLGSEIRNCAYLFDASAEPAVSRYDKTRLVRFSEHPPIAVGPAWLRRIAFFISAPRALQPMHAGTLSDLRPFRVTWSAEGSLPSDREEARFIAPICLENIDPVVVASMIRGSSAPYKQADFIANISNDGWFATQEKYQHIQTTVFRCIENRVPMVRSSNTGVSGFIDSTGRVVEMVAPNVAGLAVRRVGLDGRHTFYTRYGDVFAWVCWVFVGAVAILRGAAVISRRRGSQAPRPLSGNP